MEDDLLALETDVFRPLDEAGEVGLVADRLAWRRESARVSSVFPVPLTPRLDAPMPNDLGRASKSGFEVFLPALDAPGALATFFWGA